MSGPKRRIGFAGCPPEEVLAPLRAEELVDLDNLVEGVEHRSESLLPRTTCRIIRRILDNALALDLDEIVIDEGYGKCDTARGLADVLEGRLDIPIVRTQNDNHVGAGTPICDSDLPLLRKIELILDGLVHPSVAQASSFRRAAVGSPPPAAIWGVPAADFAIYRLFPDGTQVLGWTRCLENRTPADWGLETWVPEGVPTVFFAQTFCPKNVIAAHLARKHNGLHVDVDGALSQPVRAKIEAFLRFRRGSPSPDSCPERSRRMERGTRGEDR
ncbi:MAG: hypothetical protein ACE149_15460 [Armatimonadota bacterium]